MLSIQEIESQCGPLDENSLLLFDVDMVLTQPKESAYQLPNLTRHAVILREMIMELPGSTKDLLACLTMVESHSMLIESQAPKIIQEFQNKCPVLALTAALTGKIDNIERFEDWRFETLAKFGIDFSKAFETNERIVFDQLSSHRNNYPVYDRGILYANGEQGRHHKGDVLVQFLKRFNCTPKKIILVDDRKRNLQLVSASLAAYDEKCQFVGLHYQGGFHYKSKPITAEVCISKLQKLVEKAIQIDK